MDGGDLLWTVVVAVAMVVGLGGVVIPVLPGLALMWAAALGYGFAVGWSGVGVTAIVVLSEADRARDAALNMLRFFEDESCGQCTPCRVGCEKAVKLMQADRWDQGLLEELCQAMADASICGLGQAAPNPIRLTMAHFADEI